MPITPPPVPPPTAWVSQPGRDALARAEAAWTPDRFLAAMKPEGATAAMSCVMLADGRLDVCRAADVPQAAPPLHDALLHLAGDYRLDPSGRTPGGRVTVVAVFPRLFDHAPQIVARPSTAEIAAVMPSGAQGLLKLSCRIDTRGALDRCTIAQPVDPAPGHDGRLDTAASISRRSSPCARPRCRAPRSRPSRASTSRSDRPR